MYTIPFGKKDITVSLEGKDLIWERTSSENYHSIDLKEAVFKAMESPEGCEPLSIQLRKENPKSILLLIDDNTRSTPQRIILPVVLDYLDSCGISDSQIKILICLGTHRALSEEEIRNHIGPTIFNRIECTNLNQNDDQFVDFGCTKLGIPIQISKFVLSHDYKIAIGNIIPHMYAGWAGGAKMIQPGVTSSLTTGKTHLLAARHIQEILGNPENPVRLEMETIARTAGLNFIINTVLNDEGRTVAVVGGDLVEAHRKGCKLGEPLFSMTIPQKADIVIAGAKPADRDLWQGFKPLNNCGIAVKDGGTLILVIDAPEGIAPDHKQLVAYGTGGSEAVEKAIKDGSATDEVAAATYLAYWNTRKRITIVLVTNGISREEAKLIGCETASNIEEAIKIAESNYHGLQGGKPTYGLIKYGADLIIKCSNFIIEKSKNL